MDENVDIFELQIDVDQAVKDTAKAADEVARLKKELKDLQSQEVKDQEAIEKTNAELKVAQTEYKRSQTVVESYTTANKEQVGTITRLEAENRALRAEQKKLNLETEEGRAKNKQYVDQINKNTESIKSFSDEQTKGRLNVGQYAKDITSSITGMIPGFNAASTAAKGLGISMGLALLPITAIVAVIAGLVAYFKRTEEGGNKLNKIMAILGATFSKVVEVVSFMGEAMVKAFESPKEAITKLWNLIKENIINRFTGLIDTFKAFGKVLQGVFTLDMGKIKEGSKEFAESWIQSVTGVDNLTTKLKNGFNSLGKSIADAAAQGAKLADAEAQLKKMERTAERTKLEYQKNAELLRQQRDDQSKSVDERIKKNEELGAVLKKQLNAELAIANKALEVANMRIAIEGESTENIDEREAALLKIAEIEERVTSQESEQLSNLNGLRKEHLDLLMAQLEKERAIMEAGAKQRNADYDAQKEQELKFLDEQAARREEKRKQREERRALDLQNEYEVNKENLFAILELDRQQLELKYQQELEYAEKIGADVNLVHKKYSQAARDITKAEVAAKAQIVSQFAGGLAELFGEQTAMGKAAAVAQALANTYLGATAAFSQTPGGIIIKSAAAALAVASGLSSVKKIVAVKSGLPGDSGGANVGGGGGNQYAGLNVSTPEIGAGIVSRGTNIEQQQQQQPQNILVVDQVTNAQKNANENAQIATI